MIASHAENGASPRPLEVLGIDADEERVYRFLLTNGEATLEDVTRGLGLPARKTQRLLDAIGAKGLTTHSPERPRRYIPASPNIAIQALALQHQQAVQRAQGMIHELQLQAAAGRQGEQEHVIELITNLDVGRQLYEQILRSAQHEVAALVRPPVLYNLFSPMDDRKMQREVQARGVQFRSINDAEFLSLPDALDRVRADIRAGEEARVFPSLPFKMILVDRRIALIPLNPNQSNSPSLLVRYSALLDALYTLFEILWERATPLSFTRDGTLQTGNRGSRLSRESEELAWLMAVGLNDKNLAYNLHISLRTLERRVAELMQSLDTRTRFQAGWAAALHLSGTSISLSPQTAGSRSVKGVRRERGEHAYMCPEAQEICKPPGVDGS
jgi:sugar-specific transcriptional regulator TrmB